MRSSCTGKRGIEETTCRSPALLGDSATWWTLLLSAVGWDRLFTCHLPGAVLGRSACVTTCALAVQMDFDRSYAECGAERSLRVLLQAVSALRRRGRGTDASEPTDHLLTHSFTR